MPRHDFVYRLTFCISNSVWILFLTFYILVLSLFTCSFFFSFFFFFFFSSRRRHTRFDCDWSSDVCSSDLRRPPPGTRRHAPCPALPTPSRGTRRSRSAPRRRPPPRRAAARGPPPEIGRASCRERV